MQNYIIFHIVIDHEICLNLENSHQVDQIYFYEKIMKISW